MSFESLEMAIQRVGNPVELLRNLPYPATQFPIAPEFTNWRSEQAAWRQTCALFEQSHHMTDLFISGPGAFEFLKSFGVNTFVDFTPGKAKQYVAVNDAGFFISDGILFYLEEERFDLVTNPTLSNWMQYQLTFGGYDAVVELNDNSARRSGPPKLYRYELQGPTAYSLMERLTGGHLSEVRFFNMTDLSIAHRHVRALRHGMAGQPGFELFGPWEEGVEILNAILTAGDDFGLVRVGGKAYSTACLESGWIPRPPAAIFDNSQKAYREWVPLQDVGSLGGSMDSADITEYYVTPYDIGYGRLVKFDHDFVGREALSRHAENQRRRKVSLIWNVDDVVRAMRSHLEPGIPAKYIEMPKARYAFFQADKVLNEGQLVGISMDVGYLANEHVMLSLATVDVALSSPGTELTVLWGEEPNSRKPAVEPHRQVEIRATVAPAPYAQAVRASYRKS